METCVCKLCDALGHGRMDRREPGIMIIGPRTHATVPAPAEVAGEILDMDGTSPNEWISCPYGVGVFCVIGTVSGGTDVPIHHYISWQALQAGARCNVHASRGGPVAHIRIKSAPTFAQSKKTKNAAAPAW
jgi:hypothetical protein